MSITREAPRAAALLAAVALAGGLATTAPALAAGDHQVTVSFAGTGSWNAYLECTTSAGAHLSRSTATTASTPMYVPITFQTATFTVPDATCGLEVVRSTATTTYGAGFATNVAVTSDVTPALTFDPTIAFGCTAPGNLTGTTAVGQQLTATQPTFARGVVDPASLTYTWYRSGSLTPVQSSTSPSYRLVAADAGHQLSEVTSGRLVGLAGLSGLAGTVGGVVCPAAGSGSVTAGSPTPATAPTIQGSPVVGHRLLANAAAAPAGSTITRYQWYIVKNGHGHSRITKERVAIKGAHHRWLRTKERLAGKHVVVGVTYTLAGSKPTTVFSSSVKITKERTKE